MCPLDRERIENGSYISYGSSYEVTEAKSLVSIILFLSYESLYVHFRSQKYALLKLVWCLQNVFVMYPCFVSNQIKYKIDMAIGIGTYYSRSRGASLCHKKFSGGKKLLVFYITYKN